MAKNNNTPMTPSAAARIQSHADRTGTNADFKARAMRAAEASPPPPESPAPAAPPKK